jgi:26S proteasome regulatory subunit N3
MLLLDHTRAVIVNGILETHVKAGAIAKGLSFMDHSSLPSQASPSALGKWHFLVGLLKALSLDYGEAQHNLQMCLRRTPQNPYSAPFRSLALRHLLVVMLLQGQIPTRDSLSEFPAYLVPADAIIRGDIGGYESIAGHEQFQADGTAVLVSRLRSAVMLAGLATISAVYSRISFQDVAEILRI